MEQQELRRNNQNLIDAINNQDYEDVNNFLERGSDVNEVDAEGNSPLHYAVRLNDFKIVEMLLQHNAQVDIENNYGYRPLGYAVKARCFNTVKILLQYKAELCIDYFNIIGYSKEYPDNIKKFLYENVDVELADSFGFTALHYAVEYNDLNGIRTLISRGADVNKVTKQGRITPLHLVESTECIKILLRAGAEPNVENEFEWSPLCTLVMNPNIESIGRKERRGMIEELIRNGADCIKAIDYIQTTLHFIASMELRYCLEDILRFMARKENEHEYT